MVRNLFFSSLIVAMLLVSGFTNAQVNPPIPEAPDPDNTTSPDETTKPDNTTEPGETTKDKKKYDIKLVYAKDMKFREDASVNINMDIISGSETIEQNIKTDAQMDYEILKIDKDIIKECKLVFNKYDIVSTVNGEEQDLSIKAGFFCTIKVNDKNKIEFISESDDFPLNVKQELEKQAINSFYPPKEPVAVGNEWEIPDDVMKKQMAQYELKEVDAKLKLEKITTQGTDADKIEIANIKYTFTFDGSDTLTTLNIKGSGNGIILIDITNHRLLESNNVIKMSGSGEYMGTELSLESTITMTDKFTYDIPEKVDEEPDKPKGEEE